MRDNDQDKLKTTEILADFDNKEKAEQNEFDLYSYGAGDENRTHAACLEGKGSATELHPHGIALM